MGETESIVVHCNACRGSFRAGPKQFGKSVRCPQCDAPLSVPNPDAGKPKPADDRIAFPCGGCGKTLRVPRNAIGKRARCGCGESTVVPDPRAQVDGLAVVDSGPSRKEQAEKRLISDEQRRTKNAYADMVKAQEDTYWTALWKAVLYPWHAFGALVFFVLAVPSTVVVSEVLAKWLLIRGGDWFSDRPDSKIYFAAGVVAMAMAAVVAMLSFFCSFLFAVIRTSAEGREAVPVVEGMNHRSNAAALLTWAFVYFGPALALGFHMAGPGEGFVWGLPTVVVLLLMAVFAPMGLLCTAVVHPLAGINPVTVVKGVTQLSQRYAYLFLVLFVSAGVFIALGAWVGGHASAALNPDRPDYLIGILLRLLQGLCFMFPLVITARALGLLLRYHRDELPFEVDLFSESKYSLVPQLMALGAGVLLFLPLHAGAKEFTQSGGLYLQCARQLETVYKERLRYDSDKVHRVQSYEELQQHAGGDLLRCPAFPDELPFYKVVPGASSELVKKAPRLLWIYESKATHPDGDQRNVLTIMGEVSSVTDRQLEDLLQIQREYMAEQDEAMRESIYRRYDAKLRTGFLGGE